MYRFVLKQVRESKKMTQAELADKLGVSQSTIATWETFVGLPRAELLPYIAQNLGCPIDDLFVEEKKNENGEAG